MNPFVRFCRKVRKPAEVFAVLLITLNLLAIGSLKSFLHHWHWILFALILFVLVIYIVDSLSRKRLSKEPANV
jgi:CHASE2 domain-containing sensor protein